MSVPALGIALTEQRDVALDRLVRENVALKTRAAQQAAEIITLKASRQEPDMSLKYLVSNP